MPGLLRGVACTAVIAGTATSVSNRVSRRQAQRLGAQESAGYEQQPPPPQQYAEPAPQVDPVAELRQLAALREEGILTEEEFTAQKRRILG